MIPTKSRISQLEDQNDSLERSVAILVKEQNYEYSAPDIPRSHWIEAGFDNEDDNDDYIDKMEEFLSNMKMDTCRLRNGDGDMAWVETLMMVKECYFMMMCYYHTGKNLQMPCSYIRLRTTQRLMN